MKTLSTLTVILLAKYCFSQTTIFSTSYPNGIITESFKSGQSNFKIRPIDNDDLEIFIRISYIDEDETPGEIRLIERDADTEIVLETNPRTGSIYYSDVVTFDDASKKNLFKSYKQLPQGLIRYELMSEDEIDYSFQKYQGFFQAKFAGDQYFIVFNLTIWFKDGRVKYEYSNFTTGFSENKGKPGWWGGTSTNLNHYKTLDQLYGRDSRYGDRKHYWIPVAARIGESIATVRSQGLKVVVEEDW